MTRPEYQPIFNAAEDAAAYRLVTSVGVSAENCGGKRFLRIRAALLTHLAREAFSDLSFFLRPAFLKNLAKVLDDPLASANDCFVVDALLHNAVIAAEGVLPLCQDTGTITIIGSKGHRVLTDGRDEAALAEGAASIYREKNLRYSQLTPKSMFEEAVTNDNLPAFIDIAAAEGEEYRFLFLAKGAGASNKTVLYQESKALLNERSLEKFLKEKIVALGVAACPPYRIAVVVGGLSPEMNLKTVKLASAGALDGLPRRGNRRGGAFRDREWEDRTMAIARQTGLGAQFGGTALAHEVRFVRLPRHAGSCSVGIGVGCNADRNLKAKITAGGAFLEVVERNPARYLQGRPAAAGGPGFTRGSISAAKARPLTASPAAAVPLDLNRPMEEIRSSLAAHPVGTLFRLSGPLIVARDIAHARLKKILDESGDLPAYFKDHPIYYAGPAKTPRGLASGSFGPTTAQRMDPYLPAFMKAGASLVTLAKGNRAASVTEACKTYGGFYLGTIGGAAALVAKDHIVRQEIVDFRDLGMEAVRRIVVRDLPAFLICDDTGANLYAPPVF